MDSYTVSEDAGAVNVCVSAGNVGGFQTELTVQLAATDGKASKLAIIVSVMWNIIYNNTEKSLHKI